MLLATLFVYLKMQQRSSQPFINLKRQAASKIVYGPERKISSKDKEIEISWIEVAGRRGGHG